jgi:hypothetical protein
MPVRINSSWRLATLPTSSVMRSRSSATICEALATESLGKPVAFAVSSTLPGASAQTRLLVKGTQMTVRIRLRLSASPWTTITGLRNPGPEPVGSGKSAQYTWPWEITIRRLRACGMRRLPMLGQASYQPSRKRDSSLRSRPEGRAARCIRSRLPYKSGFVTSSAGERAAPRHGKFYRESRLPFSYPEYNRVPEPTQATWAKGDGTIR